MGKYHQDGDFVDSSAVGQLIHVISKIGHNVEVEMKYATVVEPLPNIKIKLDTGLVLDEDFLIVLDHLCDRTEEMIIGGKTETVTVKSPLKVNDRVFLVKQDSRVGGDFWVIGKIPISEVL